MVIAKKINGKMIVAEKKVACPSYILTLKSKFPHDGWDIYENVEAAYDANGVKYIMGKAE